MSESLKNLAASTDVDPAVLLGVSDDTVDYPAPAGGRP